MSLITCPTCSGQKMPNDLPCPTCGGTGVINDMTATDPTASDPRANDTLIVFRDAAKQWRWRRQSDNGNVLSSSSEGYARKDYTVDIATGINPNITVKVLEPDEDPDDV